jgi:AbrB family looped-hinge helix DNA binding protein
MMAIAKVLAKGQITIPRGIREKVQMSPGDLVRIESIGEHQFIVEVLPTLTLEEMLARFHSDEPVDLDRLRREGEEEAADQVIARLSQPGPERE